MWNDPIVDDVRKVRAAHLERFLHDIDAIIRDLMEREKQGGRTFVKVSPQRESTVANGPARDCDELRAAEPVTRQ